MTSNTLQRSEDGSSGRSGSGQGGQPLGDPLTDRVGVVLLDVVTAGAQGHRFAGLQVRVPYQPARSGEINAPGSAQKNSLGVFVWSNQS